VRHITTVGCLTAVLGVAAVGCGATATANSQATGASVNGGVPFSTAEALRLPVCASGLQGVSPIEARKDPSLVNLEEGRVLASTLPQIINRDEVGRELVRQYPRDLAMSGVQGTAMYKLLIDADGVVSHAVLAQTSGHRALDAGARTVALRMRFAPATYQQCRLPFVADIPVVFSSR
jgi:TonB family protein